MAGNRQIYVQTTYAAVATAAMAAAFAASTPSPARALGEDAPAAIVEAQRNGLRTQDELLGEVYAVELKASGVNDLQFHSWIEDAKGMIVEENDVGRTILSEIPTNRSLHPEIVVARAGDTVKMPRPHRRVLDPGVYGEAIRLAISADGYSSAIMVSQLRFFRVFADGRYAAISSNEFTDVVEGPSVPARDPSGKWIVAHHGKTFPAGTKEAQRVFAPVLDTRSRIVNADVRTSPEPEKAHGDQSELHEH